MNQFIRPPGFDEESARKRSELLSHQSFDEVESCPPVVDADSLLGALVMAALPDATYYARPSMLAALAAMCGRDTYSDLEFAEKIPPRSHVVEWREELLTRGEIGIEPGIWNCYSSSPELMIRILDARRFQRFGRRRSIPKRIKEAVFERDNFECQECGSDENLSLDHIVPWSKNGPDTIENLRVLCRSCNSRKGAKLS